MDKTLVSIILSFSEIKGFCEAILRQPDENCQPGEKLLADHILNNIIKRIFEDEK